MQSGTRVICKPVVRRKHILRDLYRDCKGDVTKKLITFHLEWYLIESELTNIPNLVSNDVVLKNIIRVVSSGYNFISKYSILGPSNAQTSVIQCRCLSYKHHVSEMRHMVSISHHAGRRMKRFSTKDLHTCTILFQQTRERVQIYLYLGRYVLVGSQHIISYESATTHYH